MSAGLTDLDHLKRGMAVLATCLVQALNESDPDFQQRFLKKLTEAYYAFRNDTRGDVLQELELLEWTRQYLTGFNPVSGGWRPFLD